MFLKATVMFIAKFKRHQGVCFMCMNHEVVEFFKTLKTLGHHEEQITFVFSIKVSIYQRTIEKVRSRVITKEMVSSR